MRRRKSEVVTGEIVDGQFTQESKRVVSGGAGRKDLISIYHEGGRLEFRRGHCTHSEAIGLMMRYAMELREEEKNIAGSWV